MSEGICPAGGTCDSAYRCARRCARWVGPAPIELFEKSAVHFVGFRDDEHYNNAVRVFGEPDFEHYVWDQRAQREITSYDMVVFARYHDQPPSRYNHDDSNQPDDPAALERIYNP